MKKIIIAIFLSAIMLLCGCRAAAVDKPAGSAAVQPPQATETEKPAPTPAETPEPDSEAINSFLERIKNNKAANSIEGFKGESTVADVVDKLGVENIKTAVISYKSKLMGYPAVVKYIFGESGGKISFTSMVFYIIPEKRSGYAKQMKKLAQRLEAELGKHSAWAGEYPNYRWERDNYTVSLSSEGKFTSSGVLASIKFISSNDSDMPDIFPDIAAGTDIRTVYRSETPSKGLEGLTQDPYLYYVSYTDKDTSIQLSFNVQGTEIKLCGALYMTLLLDTGDEDIKKCFKSFGDSMEDILGPATSIEDSPREFSLGDPPQKVNKPELKMNWPGLEIRAFYDSLHGNYYIDTVFSEEYFTEN